MTAEASLMILFFILGFGSQFYHLIMEGVRAYFMPICRHGRKSEAFYARKAAEEQKYHIGLAFFLALTAFVYARVSKQALWSILAFFMVPLGAAWLFKDAIACCRCI